MSGSMESNKLLDIRAQLEEELTWRRDEIRLLHNQLSYIRPAKDQKRYRKALLVMLYSHYEGFCATAFQIYIQAINDADLKRRELNHYLAACSFAQEFDAYDNNELKPDHYRRIFKNNLPEERKLHRFARQIDFVKNMDRFWEQPVHIPDHVVKTESNLKPVVLKQLLYRLGLPHDYFNDEEGNITELVERRNAIAHGRNKEGFEEKTYNRIEASVFRILETVIKLIMDSLKQKDYLLTS